MQRAALVLAGIGIGAATVYYYDARHAPTPTIDLDDLTLPAPAERQPSASPSPSTLARAAIEPRVIDALAANPDGTAQRAALYVAAARSDVGDVRALLAHADTLKDKTTRAFVLDVLLNRYAELDGDGAVAAASRLDVSPTTLTALYRSWFKSSQSEALSALGRLDDASATMIASALIAQSDGDAALVDRIVAAVPARLSNALLSAAILATAKTSPTAAIERARKIADPTARSIAIGQVMGIWLQRDPRAALDYVQRLDAATQRDAFARGFWSQLAVAEPGLALDRIDSVPTDMRDGVEVTALQTLAQRDPRGAIDRLSQLPRGPAHQQVVQTIARSFAQRDAEGALAWARSLQPPEPGAMAAVVAGIAETNPMRALDIAADISMPMEQMQALQSVIFSAVNRDPSTTEPLLQRVLALPNNQAKEQLVQSILSTWAAREPAKAADWVVSNGARTSVNVALSVASQYARVDPVRAASYTARLPSELRGAWVRGVAGSYAQTDPRAALDWVDQFRGSPEYDDAAIAVVQASAQVDPAGAARLVDSVGRDDYRRSAAMTLAMSWAGRDPAAAATWAASLRDPTSRQTAVTAVAQAWVQQDAPAAQAWVLSQPAGAGRDGALLGIVTVSARFGTPDTSLLSAFSSEQIRTAAVQSTAFAMAQRDAEGARAFVTANVSDPSQRDRILNFLANMPTPAGLRVGPGFIPPVGAGLTQSAVAFGPGPGGPAVIVGSGQRSLPPAQPPRTSNERR